MEAVPPPRRGRKTENDASVIRLTVDDAVRRLPVETAELFVERLRGQFREVRFYRPPPTAAATTASSAVDASVDDLPLDEGDED